MKNTSLKAALALLALVALLATKASAYTETDSEITTTLPTIDGSDLLSGTLPTSDTSEHGTASTPGYDATGAPNSVLTNNQLGALGSYTDGQEYYITDLTDTNPQSGYTPVITYSLGNNPLGYDVNEVQSITQWGNNGRVFQNYTVSFSFDGGLTYGAVPGSTYAVDYAGADANVGENVTLTGLGLVGVTNVQFTFQIPQENDAVGYSELAVDGTAVAATVPEPSSAALLLSSLVGGIVFLVRRKMANA